jgi:hypothetical protein
MKNKKDSLQNKTLTLRGQHGQCAACREYFNSTYAFDKHRVGRYTPMERRCLSPDEMRAKGMVVNSTGFWVSHAQADSSAPGMRSSRDIEGAATHA